MITTRRSFLIGLAATIAAPAIVRAASLDNLSFVPRPKPKPYLQDFAIGSEQYHEAMLPGVGFAKSGDELEYLHDFNTFETYWRRKGELLWHLVEGKVPEKRAPYRGLIEMPVS